MLCPQFHRDVGACIRAKVNVAGVFHGGVGLLDEVRQPKGVAKFPVLLRERAALREVCQRALRVEKGPPPGPWLVAQLVELPRV